MKKIPMAMKISGAKLFETYVEAKAKAVVMREKVNSVASEILSENVYLSRYNEERILENKIAWMIKEDQWKIFHTKLQARLDALGLRDGLGDGFCPALVLENHLLDIERNILDWTGKLVGEEKFADLVSLNMEKWKEAINLFCRLFAGK